MGFSSSNIKKFLTFLYIWKTETLKKISYISENGNPKKLLIFWEMDLFSPCSKKQNNSP